jgi:hypothetical protein
VRGWPRNDTEHHGRRVDGVVLVLSEAVLVIVIDARAVGWTGLARAGGLTETQRHGGLARGV